MVLDIKVACIHFLATHPYHPIKNALFIILFQVSCFFMGMLCSACGLPPLIGHILAGMILGPAGLNMISSLVQISSVGELGV